MNLGELPIPSYDVFLRQGLLGAITVMLLYACWHLFKMLKECQDDKIVILREALQSSTPLADAIKELIRSHQTLSEKISEMERDSDRGKEVRRR